MARSLSRNTKLYVSTVDIVSDTPDTTNTFEIKVLDGYSFSQGTSNEEISVDEAGCSTVRGTQSFNTALNPAEVSFSVYARPDKIDGTQTDCPENILWNAAFADTVGAGVSSPTSNPLKNPGTTPPGTLNVTMFDLSDSNHNELITLTLYFKYENTVYKITNFSVDQVEVDFSIDAIASLTFSGSGSDIIEDTAAFDLITGGSWAGGTPGEAGKQYQAAPAADANSFLRNKLSSMILIDNKTAAVGDDLDDTIATITLAAHTILLTTNIAMTVDEYAGGRVFNASSATTAENRWAAIVSNTADTLTISAGDDLAGTGSTTAEVWVDGDILIIYTEVQHAGTEYTIPITGGSLTFSNNMSYLTPEELAIVNRPLAGYTGGRSTSGTVTAYLNTGAVGSGGLLDDLLRKITEVNNDYTLVLNMGECDNNTPTFQVRFTLPHCNIGVPTTNVEDIISTEITFVAQEWDTTNDLASFEDTNSLFVEYIKT